MDTIAAIATNPLFSAGISIIRISGDNAESVIDKIFSCSAAPQERKPNVMYLGTVKGKNFSEKAFCVFYKAPKSYTGEDVAEIHCHGGRGVTTAVLNLILENGARLAEAGEFTKRAFLNGKMSLSEAEGVAEMINAETEGQVKNAYRLMSGELNTLLEKIYSDLTYCAALSEAKMDYPEETEDEDIGACKQIIAKALSEVRDLLKSSANRKILQNGADIAIIGIPNAGKSSFLNAVCKEDRAIVTALAGTTRDVVKESVEVGGIKLNFLDTAGIRESGDEIEKIGIERSRKAAANADVVIFITDATVESEKEEEIAKLTEGRPTVKVCNKTDEEKYPKEGIRICAKTGENVDKVLEEVLKKVKSDEIKTNGVITVERHISALRECEKHLADCLDGYETKTPDLIAVDLYQARKALGKIGGKDVPEETVNEIFSRFCVGK